MADGYLEKRYEEVFGKGAKKTVVKHTSLESLMEKNRSYRGYDQNFVVKRDMLERIVAVNTKIASAKNQQVLRFKLVTKETGAENITQNMKLGGLLPELQNCTSPTLALSLRHSSSFAAPSQKTSLLTSIWALRRRACC